MRHFCFCIAVLVSLLLPSCERDTTIVTERVMTADDTSTVVMPAPILPTVPPLAVLQAGEFPLWFQFTDEGPSHIERIEDALYSAALIPWPHAAHVRFTLAQDGDLLMAVNRNGFVRLSPWHGTAAGPGGVGLYHVSGGELWRLYTVGAFVQPNPNENPVVLLYRDEWFVTQDIPPPAHPLWSFDKYSTVPLAVSKPSLNAFASEEGWDLDVLRMGGSGYWYFRASRRNVANQEILMLRTDSLEREGQRVSLGDFHNAARPEPLSVAPPALREMLTNVFARGDSGSANVVSPEFQSNRRFASGSEGPPVHAFFSRGRVPGEAFLLATDSEGNALYITADFRIIRSFALPALPEGFVYTGIGMVGNTVFASWEEQIGFSIGAAGFMAIRPTELNE
ncbi:MAG: hypothetical protein FWB78_05710 [Treponema sp.]|nr:hypothetical protein [Treponema sp.]